MAHGSERMRQQQRTRIVKLYFRDSNKVMRAIPYLQVLVRDDKVVKVYTLQPGQYGKTIHEVKE